MLRPRVAHATPTPASSFASSSSSSSSLAVDADHWPASFSPTIANPGLSAFDRLKERANSSDAELEASRSGVVRSVSAGPLDLLDLELLEPAVADRGSEERSDGDAENGSGEPQEQEEDDEAALKALFFRQQQLEKQLMQEEPEQHEDVDQFLTSELRFDLPANSKDIASTPAPKSARVSRSKKASRSRKTAAVAVDPNMNALTASMHEQLSIEGSHHRRRRQSNALLPDGVLHLWIYQARQLSFRSHFESMYDRHGLHIRCYLSWRREYLSDVFESRRNVGGNMKNPIWRREDDHSRNLMRGHFSIPLGSRTSPASLPANTEVVIEIVCGILVVSSAKVSLLEFFQDRTSKSSTEDDEADQDMMENAGIVSYNPQWYPLIGQDSGLLEMGLEFIPASAFDDDDEDDGESAENLAFELEEDNNFDDFKSEDELDPLTGDSEGDAESELQDPAELNAFEEEYTQLEQRTLTRKMRFECPELTDQLEANGAQSPESESESESELTSGDVVVSNNGKTTMYIPPQCQSSHERSVGFPIEAQANQLAPTSSQLSIIARESVPAQLSSSPPRSDEIMMDEQLLDLYLFGISSDHTTTPNGMHRTSSCVSQVSQFSWEYSEYSQPSDLSMYSRKASTCATDVLAYNELIQDMETSLKDEAAQQQLGGRRNSSTSRAIPKAEGILRLAAPTSDPHPITAAMGVIPTKSSLKKSRTIRTYDESNNDENLDNDFHPASSVRETAPKGVVLFDLTSIPERLRVGFERSVSEERMTAPKTDVNLGRRRSLPVNSLSSPGIPRSHVARGNSRGHAGSRNQRPFAIQEHSDSKAGSETPQEAVARRQRSSSMHSLTDIHGRREEMRARGSLSQRQQQQQSGESRSAARTEQGSTPRTKQRRNSNTSNLVNVGGAVLGVGKFINVGSVPGVVRYVGPTNFASGTWIGIELCEKKGKNNGTVKGVEYFSCASDYGIFIRANRLDVVT